MSKILDTAFFEQRDVVSVARQLLGKVLITNIDGEFTAGLIVETEAYSGHNDKACHASNGKTNRNRVMYEGGGVAYVYLCYGIHYLFNVVTNIKDFPDVVLVRAIEPLEGHSIMLKRRNKPKLDHTLTSGPGSLSQALGINLNLYGKKLSADCNIWIEEQGFAISPENIRSTPRIGVGYAAADALLPWRFYINNNKYVSRGKLIQIAD